MAKRGRGRPKKDNPFTESRNFRFTPEQIAKLEAEAVRKRRETGSLIRTSDIIRSLVDSLPDPEEDSEEINRKAA